VLNVKKCVCLYLSIIEVTKLFKYHIFYEVYGDDPLTMMDFC